MWYGIGAGSAQAAAGGGTAAAGGGAAGAGGAAIGGPVAVGVVVAYVILHEIIKARRNERQEKFKKMHSPLQVANAANVLKSWLGENGEALDVVNSLNPEQQMNMLKIPPIYSYMDTRITAVTEQISESRYSRSKNTAISSNPQQQLRRATTGSTLTTGKTNPNWAEDLANVLLNITGGNINKITPYNLPPQQYNTLMLNMANGELDNMVKQAYGNVIPWTEQSKKYIYVNPATGAITGTLYFAVDPNNRDNLGAIGNNPQLIELSELNKYILDFKAKILKELSNGYRYIYNTSTGEADTDISGHGELNNNEQIITMNADELYFINDYEMDIKSPPKDKNSILIVVGINGDNDPVLPKEAHNPDYANIPRQLRSNVAPGLKTGYFYYKDPTKTPPESHGIEGGKKNGDEAWHELLHFMGLVDRYFEVVIEDQSNPDEVDPRSVTKPNAAAGDLAKEKDYNYMTNVLSSGGDELTGRQIKVLLTKDLIETEFPQINLIHYYSFDGVEKKYDGIDFKGNLQNIVLVNGENKVEYKGVIKPDMWYTQNFKNISPKASKLLKNNVTESPYSEWTLGEFLKLYIIINNLF